MDIPTNEEVFVKTEIFNDELHTSGKETVLDFVSVEIKQEPLDIELQRKVLQLKTPTKSNYLTLKEKSQILEELTLGAGVTTLAKKYGVAKSTICSIRAKEKLILNAVRNTFVGPGKRKTLKRPDLPKMESALYEWFLRQQEKSLPVSGQLLKEKAKSLHQQLRESENEFTASDGWLHRFKLRHGVRFLKISGEKALAQPELVDSFDQRQSCDTDRLVDCTSTDVRICHEMENIERCNKVINTEGKLTNNRKVKSAISANVAVQIFNQALAWARENDVDHADILVLRRLHEKAIKLSTDQS